MPIIRVDWFVLLNDGSSALDWRLRAIDTATESIDLQTFLWTFNMAGSTILARLIAAADRGVRVKLFVDDSLQAGHNSALLALHHHPNIEYRIYNPFNGRASGAVLRWAINLVEFHRLDHRLHNKAIKPDFSMSNAWRLQFDDNGEIVWMSDDGMLTVQPATSFIQSIEDWFLSTHPIEAEL